MENPKVVIVDDDPAKIQKYRTAVEAVGGVVLDELDSVDAVNSFMSGDFKDTDGVPDAVLTDAVLDQTAFVARMNVVGSLAASAARRGNKAKFGPLTDGAKVTSVIRLYQSGVNDPKMREQAIKSGIYTPEVADAIAGIKVVGISDSLGVAGADVERATPEQVSDYLQSL